MMNKKVIFTVLGGAAVCLGVWFNLQHSASQAANPVIESLFKSKILTVQGDNFPMEQYRGQILLVNVWAPWCAPCVEELPELSALAAQTPTVQFLGLGVDSAQNISDFGIRHPTHFPLVVAGAVGTNLAKALDNKGGALPFTVLIDATGQVVGQKTGRVHTDEIKQWLKKLK
jgi:thiol-disulfide isomerase/thioredoxin